MRQAIDITYTNNAQSSTRTNTLRSLVIDCEPGVTRRALLGTNGRTTRARLPHAIFAHARVTCAIEKH